MTGTSPESLTRLLIAALQQVRHYGPGHPAAQDSARRLETAVRSELQRVAMVRWDAGEWVTVQGTALPPGDGHANQLREHFRSRRVARLTVLAEMRSEDLAEVIRLLALEPEELIAEGGVVDALAAAETRGVYVDGPDQMPAAPAETDEYAAGIRMADGLFAAAEAGGPVDLGRVHLVLEPLLVRGEDPALWMQVLLRGHDELDPAHPVNTAFLAMQTARALGLPRQDQLDLGVAAFLHDVGMAVLPWEHRLRERTPAAGGDPLRHPVEGGMLLRHLGGRGSVPMLVAMEHHQALADASAVLPHTRLVALADYVDAMTCGRVPGVRPTTLGDLLTGLLAGQGPPFDPIHVRVLAGLVSRAAAAWGDRPRPG